MSVVFAVDGVRRRCRSPEPDWRPRRPGCDSGLEAMRTKSAPPACRVRTRLAVSAVTCRHADMRMPVERLFFGEAVADAGQHRHILIGPENPALSGAGKARIRNIARYLHRCHSHFLKQNSGRNPQPRTGARNKSLLYGFRPQCPATGGGCQELHSHKSRLAFPNRLERKRSNYRISSNKNIFIAL